MSDLTIITTSDGSHSLFNPLLNETYHSVHGAIQESQHVFIQQGLKYWLAHNPSKDIRILEIGFGTGLNAFLTLLDLQNSGYRIYYESWEAFPLPIDLAVQLNYPIQLGAIDVFAQLHQSEWNAFVSITPEFILYKRLGDILKDPLPGADSFDLIYYDAFAPSKQPQLWTFDVLKKVVDAMSPAGVWVTYCAKGQLKRDLKSLGLTVETLTGPPGKKEMVRALR